MKASVTIATWKRKELLGQVMSRLLDQTVPADQYEIIVCDSGSDDGTEELMRGYCEGHSNVIYLNGIQNILAAKRNAGIRRASAPIVIFLDDDGIPVRNFVEAHLTGHQGRKGVVFCGNVRFPEEWVRRSNYFRYRNSRHIGVSRPDIDPNNIPFMNVVVMNLSFKKDEILEKVGYVSEEFRGYGLEDGEFGYRIWRAGIKIEFNKDALVYHYEHAGSIDGYVKKLYHASRDGMPTLNRLAPECIEYTKAKFLEPIIKTNSMMSKIKKCLLQFLMNKRAFDVVKYFLNSTDHLAVCYCPYLFRYISACAYLYGCDDRKYVTGRKLSVESGWFS